MNDTLEQFVTTTENFIEQQSNKLTDDALSDEVMFKAMDAISIAMGWLDTVIRIQEKRFILCQNVADSWKKDAKA